MTRTITVRYFATLRDKAGLSLETIATSAETASELYEELKARFNFPLSEEQLKVSINRDYRPFGSAIRDGDEVVFIPPVSGG